MDLTSDPTELEELGLLFASPDRLLEAAGLRAREHAVDDPGDPWEPGLEEQVVALRVGAAHDATKQPGLARRLQELSNRLWELGRYHEAISPMEEAVRVYRNLAATNLGLSRG